MGASIISAPSFSKIIKKMATGIFPVAVFSLLLLLSLFFLAYSAEDIQASSGQYYAGLLVFNALGLLVISVFIIVNAWSLYEQIKRQAAGSRLTARLVIVFVLLSLLPVSLVYTFSVRFINNSIDSWFDVRVEKAMEHAVELSRASLRLQMKTYLRDTQSIVDSLTRTPDSFYEKKLEEIRLDTGASEMAVLADNNQMIASSSDSLLKIAPPLPDKNILLQVGLGEPYIGLDQNDDSLLIKVVLPFENKVGNDRKMVLLAYYPVSNVISEHAKKVEEGVKQYKKLVFLRTPLKASYILTLSLMLLMSLLTAVLAAFYFARKLMEPVNKLVEGTKDVAAGNYQTRLPPSGNDELGFLVQSFNIMTFRLQNADDEIRKTQKMLERQRFYLQTVLSSLSSGVMTFNDGCVLQVYNDKASELLDTDLRRFEDRGIDQIRGRSGVFNQFLEQISEKLQTKQKNWQEQIEIFTSRGRRVLLCKATGLTEETGGRGVVLVLDDITELLSAQKHAAWSEVARRLAHEIKNPLTPIQLATERMRKKYLQRDDFVDSALMDKCTLTIIKQVRSMQDMVKAFAEYANMPKSSVSKVNVNDVVEEVVTLYQSLREDIEWHIELDKNIKRTKLDESRIRQVLGNLIKNAIESQQSNEKPWIAIKTRWVTLEKNSFIEIMVEDKGEGIDPEIKKHMFEPYNTSKPEGTGLGLAIVKNIIEESGGVISVESIEGVGTTFKIKLPGVN